MLFAQKQGLAHPYFYIEMNHFNIVFHMTGDKWQRFYALKYGFQRGSLFLRPKVRVRVRLLHNVLNVLGLVF